MNTENQEANMNQGGGNTMNTNTITPQPNAPQWAGDKEPSMGDIFAAWLHVGIPSGLNANQINLAIGAEYARARKLENYDTGKCQYLVGSRRAQYTPDHGLGYWRVAIPREYAAYQAASNKRATTPLGLLSDEQLNEYQEQIENLQPAILARPDGDYVRETLEAVVSAAKTAIAKHKNALAAQAKGAEGRRIKREVIAAFSRLYDACMEKGEISISSGAISVSWSQEGGAIKMKGVPATPAAPATVSEAMPEGAILHTDSGKAISKIA